MSIKSVFITGGTGFIGKHLSNYLKNEDYKLTHYVRNKLKASTINWLQGTHLCDSLLEMTAVDCVIHLGARVHQMDEKGPNLYSLYQRDNVDFTINLAKQAIKCHVKKFIFVSTVKVYGEQEGHYTETSDLFPEDDYARSKLEAENKLKVLFKPLENCELIILRLPLVYGDGNKGNMATLVKCAKKGYRLPLGNAHKKRSFLFVGNLVAFIGTIIKFNDRVSSVQVLNVTDDDDMSVVDLYRKLLVLNHKKADLFFIPIFLIKLFIWVPFVKARYKRLFEVYTFSCSRAKQVYLWKPKYTIKDYVLSKP